MSARRSVQPLPLVLAALAVLLCLPAAPALACSCAGPPDDRASLARADVVVSGQVLERREPGALRLSSADPATYVVRVERVHKGEAPPVVEVQTPASGASCGLELPAGGPALLFLALDDGTLRAGLCDGSRTATAAGAVAALGEGRPPRSGSAVPGAPGGATALPVAVAAALLLLAGAAVVLHRRLPLPT